MNISNPIFLAWLSCYLKRVESASCCSFRKKKREITKCPISQSSTHFFSLLQLIVLGTCKHFLHKRAKYLHKETQSRTKIWVLRITGIYYCMGGKKKTQQQISAQNRSEYCVNKHFTMPESKKLWRDLGKKYWDF